MDREHPLRVMHFVSGGFSGATSVATTLARAAQGSPRQQALLVLRSKRQTDPARVQALRDSGLDVEEVPGWSHVVTILALVALCRRWKPDILVAHGFSEHLWGRWAGWLALALVVVAFAYLCFTVLAPWQLGKNTRVSPRPYRDP